MKPTVRAWPFESKYLRDFAVVEERHGNLRLFPATEQLPVLAKAIEQEFQAGLTPRLATTDGRGDLWRKLQLHKAAQIFGSIVNAARPDHLHVWLSFTPDLVTQVVLTQQITRVTPRGNHHWYRQFRGTDFLPDIHLAGKRLVFSGHAVGRYSQRSQSEYAHPSISLMWEFWQSVPVLMQLDGHSTAFVMRTSDHTVAILPFEESDTEFFFLTVLSPHETKTLTVPAPQRRLHFHYGPNYAPPVTRNLDLDKHAAHLLELWRAPAAQTPPAQKPAPIGSWVRLVKVSELMLRKEGHNEESKIMFYDDVHGPGILTQGPPRRIPARAPSAGPLAALPSGPPKPPPLPDWLKPSPPA